MLSRLGEPLAWRGERAPPTAAPLPAADSDTSDARRGAFPEDPADARLAAAADCTASDAGEPPSELRVPAARLAGELDTSAALPPPPRLADPRFAADPLVLDVGVVVAPCAGAVAPDAGSRARFRRVRDALVAPPADPCLGVRPAPPPPVAPAAASAAALAAAASCTACSATRPACSAASSSRATSAPSARTAASTSSRRQAWSATASTSCGIVATPAAVASSAPATTPDPSW
mmetsp:Transcript_23527/g.89387  ORF Transcript_23527/g.89387 Transcript_23527/m.89387 type:complete len:233 (+) Transcript_23527:207-905(+)